MGCLLINWFLHNSADSKLMIIFLFFQENRHWHFMQIVSKMRMKYQCLFSGEKKKQKKKTRKNISKFCLLKFLSSMLIVIKESDISYYIESTAKWMAQTDLSVCVVRHLFTRPTPRKLKILALSRPKLKYFLFPLTQSTLKIGPNPKYICMIWKSKLFFPLSKSKICHLKLVCKMFYYCKF